ncbi:hypothetical protein CDAR_373561 [Caerostris darwini]|uniref:Uncharacterized protein n=1 Tax=Caerostris darwini TaxID=1538125 RepID=A0AAV4QHM2_9ARAC|nr:hypothetical protein CDAR_373561 [Caerostris darwini]
MLHLLPDNLGRCGIIGRNCIVARVVSQWDPTPVRRTRALEHHISCFHAQMTEVLLFGVDVNDYRIPSHLSL